MRKCRTCRTTMEHVAETTGKEFWWCPKCGTLAEQSRALWSRRNPAYSKVPYWMEGRPETAKKLLKREKPNILLGIEWEYE